MFVVETVIKCDSEFVPLERARGPAKDPDYVQGAIIMRADGKVLLGPEEWDDVNWLWPSLVEAVEALLRGEQGRARFPDQPIEVIFEPGAGGGKKRDAFVTVRVESRTLKRRAAVARDELIAGMRAGALAFCSRIAVLSPRSGGDFAILAQQVGRWA